MRFERGRGGVHVFDLDLSQPVRARAAGDRLLVQREDLAVRVAEQRGVERACRGRIGGAKGDASKAARRSHRAQMYLAYVRVAISASPRISPALRACHTAAAPLRGLRWED